ncbi:MAG: AraC family transcriptional regulator, partial [Lentisphaerae bacterium]
MTEAEAKNYPASHSIRASMSFRYTLNNDHGLFAEGMRVEVIGFHCCRSRFYHSSAPLWNLRVMLFHSPVEVRVKQQPFQKLSVPTFVCFDSREPSSYGRDGNRTWDHSWVRLGGRHIFQWFRQYGIPFGVPIPCLDEELWLANLLLLQRELDYGPKTSDPAITHALVTALIRRVRRDYLMTTRRESLPDVRLLKAMDYIRQHLSTPIQIQELARVAGMSLPHFRAQFRKQFDQSPGQIIRSQRMQLARTLLEDSSL